MASIKIASFDIGRVNFAFYVGEINVSQVLDLSSSYQSFPSPEKNLFNPRNKRPFSLSSRQKELMSQLHTSIHSCCYRVRNISSNAQRLDMRTRSNLFQLLSEYHDVWKEVDILIIERQYVQARGKKATANFEALRLAETCFTWFQIHYPRMPCFYYPASIKVYYLGCPRWHQTSKGIRKITKAQRKKWAEKKAHEIANLNHDTSLLQYFATLKQHKQKIDDVADCIIQCHSFVLKEMVMSRSSPSLSFVE